MASPRLICISCLFCVLLSFSQGRTQTKPIFLPEDIEATTLEPKCLCKPGVKNKTPGKGLDISFLKVLDARIKPSEDTEFQRLFTEYSIRQFNLKLRFPVINKEGFKMLVGLTYRPEHTDISRLGDDDKALFSYLDDLTLKSSGFESILVKSWNEKIYTSFRMRILYNGDYSGIINFKDRYAIYNASGILGIKKHAHKEWGFGLNFSHSFRNTLILPFVLYNHTFNDRWGIETVLPAIAMLRYNLKDGTVFHFGFRYNSRSYAIQTDEDLPRAFNFNHSEMRTAFNMDKRIHPWIWLSASFGLQYNFSTDFNSKSSHAQSFQVQPQNSPYFKIGFSLSPPKDYLEKHL